MIQLVARKTGASVRKVCGACWGGSIADHIRSDLVLDALNQALGTRSPNRTIFHSDRGSQYASTLLRKVLSKAGMRQSM
jgi:putative transposase